MPTQRTAPQYPEHDKLHAVKDESQAIGEFLDIGLGQQGILLAEVNTGWTSDRLVPASKSIRAILAEYFGIDEDALEREKRAMLDALREANR